MFGQTCKISGTPFCPCFVTHVAGILKNNFHGYTYWSPLEARLLSMGALWLTESTSLFLLQAYGPHFGIICSEASQLFKRLTQICFSWLSFHVYGLGGQGNTSVGCPIMPPTVHWADLSGLPTETDGNW